MKDIKIKEISVKYLNNRIYGKAFIPETVGKKLPAVILCHGYNSSHSDLSDVALALSEAGAFAYCFDFCGGSVASKSSGTSVEMSIQTEINDLRAVIGMIKNVECVDKNRIYLYGESQGGFVSALTASDMPDDIAGMFLTYPAFCIPDDWKDKSGIISAEIMGMKLSDKFYKELPQYDVFDRIKRFKKKVIISHGTADGVVPISYSQRAVKSFADAELVIYEGEGHVFTEKARHDLISRVCKMVCG